MSEKLKPCHCGHEGRIDGTHNSFWYEATCPSCNRRVSAFTTDGLAETWNKEPEQQQTEGE